MSITGARLGACLAAGGVVVAALLPWTISGSAERNSFSSVRSARTLEVAGTGAAQAVLAVWYFVPALAAVALLLLALGRGRPASAVAAAVGLATIGLSTAILRAPIGRGVGVLPALVLGAVALGFGLGGLRRDAAQNGEP